jgi:hypothetical protein
MRHLVDRSLSRLAAARRWSRETFLRAPSRTLLHIPEASVEQLAALIQAANNRDAFILPPPKGTTSDDTTAARF